MHACSLCNECVCTHVHLAHARACMCAWLIVACSVKRTRSRRLLWAADLRPVPCPPPASPSLQVGYMAGPLTTIWEVVQTGTLPSKVGKGVVRAQAACP